MSAESRYIRMPVPQKILIIKPSSLGDVVHGLPFLAAMRDLYPKAEIHWLIAAGLDGLLLSHPMVNRLWVVNKDRWKRARNAPETVAEMAQLARDLRNEAFDMVVDLQGLLRSGLMTFSTGAPIRIGFREAREGSALFYTHKIGSGRDVHAVDRLMTIAAALGYYGDEITFPLPLVKEPEEMRALKDDMGDYAVIIPGARWKTKQWPADRFGRLAALLPERSIVVGSKADADIADTVVAHSGGKAVSMAGKTDLRELICLIRGARYAVSNDSGPMHIAAAVGKPVVAVFGPTNPVRTGPYGRGHRVVQATLSCGPCYKKTCRDLRCMEAVSVEQVYEAVRDVTPAIA